MVESKVESNMETNENITTTIDGEIWDGVDDSNVEQDLELKDECITDTNSAFSPESHMKNTFHRIISLFLSLLGKWSSFHEVSDNSLALGGALSRVNDTGRSLLLHTCYRLSFHEMSLLPRDKTCCYCAARVTAICFFSFRCLCLYEY